MYVDRGYLVADKGGRSINKLKKNESINRKRKKNVQKQPKWILVKTDSPNQWSGKGQL